MEDNDLVVVTRVSPVTVVAVPETDTVTVRESSISTVSIPVERVVVTQRTDREVVTVAGTGPMGPQGEPGVSGGATLSYIAGESLGGHRVVTANIDGEVIYAHADNFDHILGAIGMTTGAAVALAPVEVAVGGEVIEPTWNWVPYQPIYLTGTGQLTQTVPTSGYMLQVAIPTSPTSVVLALKMPVTLL